MGVQSWTVAEAKAKFSEIIERAMAEGPQTITRRGPHRGCGGWGRGMATKDKARRQPGRILCGISAAGIGPEGSSAQRTASED